MDSSETLPAVPSPALEVAEGLTEEHIWRLHTEQPFCDSRGWAVSGFAYPPQNPLIYVKYGHKDDKSRDSEARTQQFAYDALQNAHPDKQQGIRIPKIYRVIRLDNGWTYIIMEYVQGTTLRQLMQDRISFIANYECYYAKVEMALRLLLSFPVPQDAAPGPYGGGVIRHPLFKDCVASIEYDSVDTLERHLNNVATLRRKDGPMVRLERDLHFVFSDLYGGNFMFTATGDIYIIDFEQANFLPLSFMTYALIQDSVVCLNLREKFQVDLSQDNIEVMQRICHFFVMSKRTIGLPLATH